MYSNNHLLSRPEGQHHPNHVGDNVVLQSEVGELSQQSFRVQRFRQSSFLDGTEHAWNNQKNLCIHAIQSVNCSPTLWVQPQPNHLKFAAKVQQGWPVVLWPLSMSTQDTNLSSMSVLRWMPWCVTSRLFTSGSKRPVLHALFGNIPNTTTINWLPWDVHQHLFCIGWLVYHACILTRWFWINN